MKDKKAKSARTSCVISEEELAGALERVVPHMEVATVKLVAEQLSAHFGIASDVIREEYREFLLKQVPLLKPLPASDKREGVERLTGSKRPNSVKCSTPARKMVSTSKPIKDHTSSTTPTPGTSSSRKLDCGMPRMNIAHSSGRSGKTLRADSSDRSGPSPKTLRAMSRDTAKSPRKGLGKLSRKKLATKHASQEGPEIGSGATHRVDGLTTSRPKQHFTKSSATQSEKSVPPHEKGRAMVKRSRPSGTTQPSQRGLANLMELAKTAGLFSPRSKLARSVREASDNATKMDLLRNAFKTENIRFVGAYPTKLDIRKCKTARERQQDLDGIDVANILPATMLPRCDATEKPRFSDSPTLLRADPLGHYIYSGDEEKEDDSDASVPSSTSFTD